jgi:MFS transporter, PPP family, 3-phenylpropionic acid transporter
MSSDKSLAIRLCALQAASFFGPGFYLPFFPLWLQSKALSPTLIGFVVAIPIVVRILATAPLLSLADRSFGARRLLIASHLGQVVGFPLLMLVESNATIIALVALVSVAQAAIIPGNDHMTISAVQRHPRLNYGRIRGCGSIAFFVANIAGGYLIGAFGPNAVILALTLIPLMAIAATWLVPDQESGSAPDVEASSPVSKALPHVLWIVMIAAALTQSSHGALNAFASIHWRALGFADSVIGYFWAIGVIAEILVFIVLGQAVGRGSGLGLLLIGSGAAAIRFAIMALNPGLAVTFVLQAMHSLSFGASHLGMMAALTALSPPGVRGRAQGIYGSLAALVTAGSTIVSGMIYKDGGGDVFAAMAPLGALGFVLTLLAVMRLRAQPHNAG